MLRSLFDSNEKQIKKFKPVINNIASLEPEFQKYTDKEIIQKTIKWKNDIRSLSKQKRSHILEEILPEAFALVREASKRSLGMRHYDVQLIAGIALHQGKIAEQKTGEGKTLTATLPLYLNSLTGDGVHLVTPNDYLSRHGAGWMGPLYIKLGISVGVIMQERAFIYDEAYESSEFQDEYAKHLREVPRRHVYECDIVYGTNHEFGFDYLRDNMARSLSDIVQINPNKEEGAHNFAIVDEVDSILIDFARTPLIISTTTSQPSERYHQASEIVNNLIKGTDYEVDEKFRQSSLSDLGIRRVENMLGISNLYEQDFEMVHLLEQALTAKTLYEKDRDYVVKDSAVVIVDQFTGRLLPSNRYSNGLHQAIESKEGVTIQQETRSVAEISYQNYFRMYDKLAGMTGTALTEAEEFFKIYKLEVVAIPTNKPNIRKDINDLVYKTEGVKFAAVATDIEARHKKGQPILIGTTSVEKSQLLHDFLDRKKIPHQILNAKNHEKEALIIAQAGRPGAVTVSTNMAGRGVDIILGGDPPNDKEQEEVKKSGGLHVIGTERHESRRVDNQLRGRSARQGDPGSSQFYVSLQDELMRIFGGAQVEKLMSRFGLDERIPLTAGIVTKAIENAQKKVEGFNFDRRKYVVEMDDVINVHRDVIYKLRRRILEIGEGNEEFKDWFIDKLVQNSDYSSEKWQECEVRFKDLNWQNIVSQLSLPVIDFLWMEHLVDMDNLREGIQLRGYAQKDPKVEFKREGHLRFELLIKQVYTMVSERLRRFDDTEQVGMRDPTKFDNTLRYDHGELETGVSEESLQLSVSKKHPEYRSLQVQPIKSGANKVGRNDACPCGSGKKYKHCHGKER